MAEEDAPNKPRKKAYRHAFGKPVAIDNSGEITRREVEAALEGRDRGVTLSVRDREDAANRGGYLFSIRLTETGAVQLLTYTRKEAYTFAGLDGFVRFVNHASGRKYDPEMWAISQEINLRILSQGAERESKQ